jgi:tRNA dimethylallyltransferase
MSIKIIIICGPTAVGKTAVGVDLALRLGGEVVSADSQQVWRHFDIGTAKPTREERSLVPHHLIDIAEPTERFDAARFVELADAAIANIASRGKVPIVVGGTGMYIRMLVHGVCDTPPRDDGIRAALEREIEERGLTNLHARLKEIDPESAAKISPNDSTRIVRALEIFELTGEPASRARDEHRFAECRYDAQKIGLECPREELYRRINERCDRMVEAGLVDEVRALLAHYGEQVQPFAAVGYKEMLAHVKGEMTLDEAIRLMQRNSRHFAKRQLTWFRTETSLEWIRADVNDAKARVYGLAVASGWVEP